MRNFWNLSQTDLYRYYGTTNLKSFLKGWFVPGFRYTFFLRMAHEKKGTIGVVAKFFLRKYSIKYGIQISPSASIGQGFYIGHFGTIVINGNTIIGKNCNISQGVTIGQTNRGRLIGTPVIGDFVWIGTNAVLVGKISIGSDVLIAPGAYVNFDVPDHSIVIGNPGVIKFNAHATKDYINRII